MVLVLLALAGCQTLGYYGQAVTGQWQLLRARQPVDALLERLDGADPAEASLRQRLSESQALLAYAEASLGLEVGGRYRSYVALPEDYVVYNLFAAPPLSLSPEHWCYPFVGCVPYRGYFRRELAERAAARQSLSGSEVYLGDVPAYSTLGWFDDPLLSSFIDWPLADFAVLLLHELAHGRVWVSGDAAFNEAYATFVGRRGMRDWLASRDERGLLEDYDARRHARRALFALLADTRAALDAVYRSAAPADAKSRAKARLLEATRRCYRSRREAFGGGRYDGLMEQLNNALLASIATYEDKVPAFAALWQQAAGDWPAFHGAVERLAALDADAREARLSALAASADEEVAAAGDDDGTDEVQCQSLARHGLDAEAAR